MDLEKRVGAGGNQPVEDEPAAAGLIDPIRVPGKLYLAGEYAVTQPGRRALVMAVDRYLSASIVPTRRAHGLISSDHFSEPLSWRHASSSSDAVSQGAARKGVGAVVGDTVVAEAVVGGAVVGGAVEFLNRLPEHELVALAFSWAFDYLRPDGREGERHGGLLAGYDVILSSELDDAASGVKYGLGSSGAVVVALIRAVALAHGQPISAIQVYKLAMLVLAAAGHLGSGGDVAASSHGGMVAYRSPDSSSVASLSDRVRKPAGGVNLRAAVDAAWPGLEIIRIPRPPTVDAGGLLSGVELEVGWTRTAHSTHAALDRLSKVKHDREEHADYFESFADRSDSLVEGLQAGLLADDAASAALHITQARELLGQFAAHYGVEVETPQLRRLIELSAARGAAAKSSGAGGGDCGIALVSAGAPRGDLVKCWSEHGILPLKVRIAAENTDNVGAIDDSTRGH